MKYRVENNVIYRGIINYPDIPEFAELVVEGSRSGEITDQDLKDKNPEIFIFRQ